MSNHEPERMPERMPERDISDEDLPEDLQPTDDNPLAKDLTGEDNPRPVEELDMQGGKTPEGSDDDGDHPADTDGGSDSDDDGPEAASGS